MEIEWHFCDGGSLLQVAGNGSEAKNAGVSGLAGAAKGAPKGLPEPVRQVGCEERAHGMGGVPDARRESGLEHGSMTSQSSCTGRAMALR